MALLECKDKHLKVFVYAYSFSKLSEEEKRGINRELIPDIWALTLEHSQEEIESFEVMKEVSDSFFYWKHIWNFFCCKSPGGHKANKVLRMIIEKAKTFDDWSWIRKKFPGKSSVAWSKMWSIATTVKQWYQLRMEATSEFEKNKAWLKICSTATFDDWKWLLEEKFSLKDFSADEKEVAWAKVRSTAKTFDDWMWICRRSSKKDDLLMLVNQARTVEHLNRLFQKLLKKEKVEYWLFFWEEVKRDPEDFDRLFWLWCNIPERIIPKKILVWHELLTRIKNFDQAFAIWMEAHAVVSRERESVIWKILQDKLVKFANAKKLYCNSISYSVAFYHNAAIQALISTAKDFADWQWIYIDTNLNVSREMLFKTARTFDDWKWLFDPIPRLCRSIVRGLSHSDQEKAFKSIVKSATNFDDWKWLYCNWGQFYDLYNCKFDHHGEQTLIILTKLVESAEDFDDYLYLWKNEIFTDNINKEAILVALINSAKKEKEEEIMIARYRVIWIKSPPTMKEATWKVINKLPFRK